MLFCDRCPENVCEMVGQAGSSACPTNARADELRGILGEYSGADLDLAANGIRVNDLSRMQLTRIEEIMAFARISGFTHLGIGFCSAMVEEARAVGVILRENGFTVSSAICKVGSFDKEEIRDEAHPFKESDHSLCNSIAQARLLNEAGTQLNLVMGLCVGHDALFMRHSEAPCTVFAVRDWTCGNDPLEPVRQRDGRFAHIRSFVPNAFGE